MVVGSGLMLMFAWVLRYTKQLIERGDQRQSTALYGSGAKPLAQTLPSIRGLIYLGLAMIVAGVLLALIP